MSDRRAPLFALALVLVVGLVLFALRSDEVAPPPPPSSSPAAASSRSPGEVGDGAPVESVTAPGPVARGDAAGPWSRHLEGEVLLDDAPWSGALLWTRVDADLRPVETLRVATDAEGRFVVRPGQGAWTVALEGAPAALSLWAATSADDFEGWCAEVVVLVCASNDDEFSDARHERKTLWLGPDDEHLFLRARTPRVLDGLVVDDVTEQPIAGASARLVCKRTGIELTATGDAAGTLRLLVPQHAREATLFVSANGYGPSGLEWHVASEDPLPSAGRTVVFRLRPALTLRGRVVDGQGRAVIDALVSVGAVVEGPLRSEVYCTWEGRSDGLGRFVIDGIAERADLGGDEASTDCLGPHGARVDLQCSAPGFDDVSLGDVAVGPDAPPIEVRLDRPRRLVGRVIGPHGPLAGAHVIMVGGRFARNLADVGFIGHRATHRYPRPVSARHAAATDDAGAFVIAEAPERAWVIAEAAWMAPRVLEVHGPLEDLTIRLEAAAPPIEGRVLAADGLPMGGVTVTAYLAGRPVEWPTRPSFRLTAPGVREVDLREAGVDVVGATLTRDDGTFRLDGLPDARLDLSAWDPSGSEPSRLRDVAPGSAGVVIHRTSRPSSDLTLTLSTPDGGPLEDVRVSVFRADLTVAESWTYSHSAEPDAVPFEWGERLYVLDEPLLVQVVARGRRPEVLRVVARAGQPLALGPLALTRAGGELALRVRWARRPAPGLTASWVDPGTGLSVTTRVRWLADPTALVVLGHAAAGALEVVLTRDDDVVVARYSVSARDGETTILDLDLTGP